MVRGRRLDVKNLTTRVQAREVGDVHSSAGTAMDDARQVRTTQAILILLVIWIVTNLSTMISAVHDGRSVSLGLFRESVDWFSVNTNDELAASIDQLRQHEVPVFSEWLLTQTYQDAMNYVKMAMGDGSYEPYSLRVLYPKVIGWIAAPVNAVVGGSGARRVSTYALVFIAANVTLFLCSIFIAARFLVSEGLPAFEALTLATLAFLQLGFLSTLHSPMTDQASVFLTLCFLVLMERRRDIAVFVVATLMILTKDSLIILAAVPLVAFLFDRRWVHLLVVASMGLVFVGLRVYTEVDPLSVQFGWNLSKGEVKTYIFLSHFGSVPGIINWLLGLWSSFGPALVVGPLLATRRDVVSLVDRRRLLLVMGVSALFMAAQALLAGRIARTVTPASVPLVLVTFAVGHKYYRTTIDRAIERLLC